MPSWVLLGSAAPTSATDITFSSIPNTYTDLVLHASSIIMDNSSGINNASYFIQVNGVTTGGVYASRVIRTNVGSSTITTSASTGSTGELTWNGDGNNAYGNFGRWHFLNYANTNMLHTAQGIYGNSVANVGLDILENWNYRQTTAISSIKFYPQRNNFVTGTKLYLWGIQAA